MQIKYITNIDYMYMYPLSLHKNSLYVYVSIEFAQKQLKYHGK